MKKARISEQLEHEEAASSEDDSSSAGEDEHQEEEEDDEDVAADGEEVQLELEARAMNDADAPAMTRLLCQTFLKWPVDVARLVAALISQAGVGSVLKQLADPEDDEDDGDEAMLALCSALPLSADACQSLQRVLVERAPAMGEVLRRPDSRVALLLNERVVNLPSSVAAPMMRSLLTELATAKKSYTHFVAVCKTCRQRPAKRRGGQPAAAQPMHFVNEEEESLAACADVQRSVSVAAERADAGWGGAQRDLEPFRTLVLVPRSKFEQFVETLTDV